jgi:arginyl-tRNA synthetase
VVANYLYNLAKTFNRFYNEVSILNAPTPELIQFRMTISAFSGKILKHGLGLLGIEVPDRM